MMNRETFIAKLLWCLQNIVKKAL